MNNEQAIKVLLDEWKCIDRNDGINCDRQCEKCDLVMDSAILKDAYNMAIQALSQEPCDDAISRQAVLDQTYLWSKDEFLRVTNPFDYLSKRINSLPPVTQKCEKCAMNGSSSKYCDNCKSSRHKGHWIPIYQGDEIINYHCSECELGDTNGSINLYGWDYCRRCGCRNGE